MLSAHVAILLILAEVSCLDTAMDEATDAAYLVGVDLPYERWLVSGEGI